MLIAKIHRNLARLGRFIPEDAAHQSQDSFDQVSPGVPKHKVPEEPFLVCGVIDDASDVKHI